MIEELLFHNLYYMQFYLTIAGVIVWFSVWWKTTSAAWADSKITGNIMRALACTVILGPFFATIAMLIVIFVGGRLLGIP